MVTKSEIGSVAIVISKMWTKHFVDQYTASIKTYNNSIAEHTQTIKEYEKTIEGYQQKINMIKEAAATIKKDNIAKQIKKLPFVASSLSVKRGYIEIRTKHLTIKRSRLIGFNAGNYLIRLYTDGKLRVVREKYEKAGMVGYNYQHLFVAKNGEVCFGGNSEKFDFEIAVGRYDIALSLLWNMLSSPLRADGHDIYIHYAEFKKECKRPRRGEKDEEDD